MSLRLGTPVSAGDVFELVRSGRAVTRSEIGRVTGMSRTAVTARVSLLLASGLVGEDEEGASTGGRPPSRLGFRPEAGVVLAAAVGRSRTQLAVCDLAGSVLRVENLDQEVGGTPDEVMPGVVDRFAALLGELGLPLDRVRGAGLSIPGTVDIGRGASVDSPIMKGWNGVPLAPYIQALVPVPTFVDNDANVLALSERRGHLEQWSDAVLVKASTGLGAGIVCDGRLIRGGQFSAGEIGHSKTPAAEGRACRCGEEGCLDAIAGGWALVAELAERGVTVGHVRDVVRLAQDGDVEARRLVRESGRRVGEVLGALVNALNPQALVIGGDMAAGTGPYDTFVAGVRETLYRHATALATRELQIVPASHGDLAGVVGCATLALEHVLDPRVVDLALADL